MDALVARSMAKWPEVPAVYGWLELDRRGEWRIKGERVVHAGLREFIARNYQADERGRWYFQNGPQRVFVTLAYTPFVVHHEAQALVDQCGRPVAPRALYVDDEGSLLVEGGAALALLDDRDLERYVDAAERLPRLARAEVPGRFGFCPRPQPL
ncbi:MAG TPA: DUF2946 family protein [Burkholderiales bacterium]|nr:DUF2946 family protein [Burkholderiales bacterium]